MRPTMRRVPVNTFAKPSSRELPLCFDIVCTYSRAEDGRVTRMLSLRVSNGPNVAAYWTSASHLGADAVTDPAEACITHFCS